jgi:hypothetical protein
MANGKKGAARGPKPRKLAATRGPRRAIQPRLPKRAKLPKTVGLVQSLRALDPALHQLPPPSGQSLGNFTTVNSVHRSTIGTSTTVSCFVMVCWTPSGLRALRWTYNPSGGAVGSFSSESRVIVKNLDTAYNPAAMSMRPLRLSARLRNQTIFTSQMGIVQSLVIPDPIDWTGGFTAGTDLQPSSGQASNIYDLMQNSPLTRTYTATDYQHTKSFVLPPASEVAYHEWRNVVGVSSAEATPWTNAQTAIIQGTDSNAMGVLLLHFPSTSTAQIYSMTLHTQDACRYSPVHVLAHFAAPQPSADAKLVHAVHTRANRDPSVPVELAQTAVGGIAALASKVNWGSALNLARRGLPAIADRAAQLAIEDGAYMALLA